MLINITTLVIPLLILFCILVAIIKKKSPFETFMDGVRDGLKLFIQIFPSILAMLLAITLLKASGFITDFGKLLSYLIKEGDFLAQLTPMMLFRPLSGSAALSVLHNVCSVDADGIVCKTASTLQASTDTTFYVITLYYSSVGITKWRHSIKSGLTADVFGMVMGIILSLIFLSTL